MKSKGFTLIEILAVIVIISLVGIVVTISLSKTLKNTKGDICTRYVEEIEDAACSYAGLRSKQKDIGVACNQNTITNNGVMCTLTLKNLVDSGLLDEQKDSCTEEDMNMNSTVVVTFINGEKKCEYKGIREYAK